MATDKLETSAVAPPPQAADEQPVNADAPGPAPAEDQSAVNVIEKELNFLHLEDPETPAKTEPDAATSDSHSAGSALERSWRAWLTAIPLRILIFIVTVLDLPVALLGPRFRPLFGYIAIGTAIMAVATWIGGPRLAAAYATLP